MYKEKLKDTPREVLNWRLWFAVVVFGVLGAARGLDEGNVSGMVAQLSFIDRFGLEDPNLSEQELADRESNITSMVQLGSIAGALAAMYLCDKLGRVRSLQFLCLVWIAGVVIQITSKSLGQLLAGRFIAGLGIGQTTVVGPAYLAEVSPKAIRGLCTCMFSGTVYLGIMLAYFANYGTSKHFSDNNQWIIPTSVQLIFAGLTLLGSLLVLESPRWLLKVGRDEDAVKNLKKLRQLPVDNIYVQTELLEVKEQLEREQEATRGTSWMGPWREFALPENRYRLMLGICSQLLGQWSGANSLTIYAPKFFKLVGVEGQEQKLFSTAILGVVKFVSALVCAFFLIDFIGRKRSLTIGISLQTISILYIGIYLAITGVADQTDVDKTKITQSEKRAQTAAIVSLYINGAAWAIGWNSIQYTINAEIFPLRLRSIGTALVMCFHFVNQYGNSKALPLMLIAMDNYGAMLFFAAVCFMGLAWTWFFLPETAGLSLEALDEVFALPWWKVGRLGNKYATEMAERERTEIWIDKEKNSIRSEA